MVLPFKRLYDKHIRNTQTNKKEKERMRIMIMKNTNKTKTTVAIVIASALAVAAFYVINAIELHTGMHNLITCLTVVITCLISCRAQKLEKKK